MRTREEGERHQVEQLLEDAAFHSPKPHGVCLALLRGSGATCVLAHAGFLFLVAGFGGDLGEHVELAAGEQEREWTSPLGGLSLLLCCARGVALGAVEHHCLLRLLLNFWRHPRVPKVQREVAHCVVGRLGVFQVEWAREPETRAVLLRVAIVERAEHIADLVLRRRYDGNVTLCLLVALRDVLSKRRRVDFIKARKARDLAVGLGLAGIGGVVVGQFLLAAGNFVQIFELFLEVPFSFLQLHRL